MRELSKEKQSSSFELPKVEISVPAEAIKSEPLPEVVADREPVIREVTRVIHEAQRRRLPSERQAIVHKFSIGDQEGFLTVGLYDDGTPGEIFIRLAKADATTNGLLDAFAVTTSVAWQYGVPLEALVSKLTSEAFDPSGATPNPAIPETSSIIDYISRWLAIRFLSPESLKLLGIAPKEELSPQQLMLDTEQNAH